MALWAKNKRYAVKFSFLFHKSGMPLSYLNFPNKDMNAPICIAK